MESDRIHKFVADQLSRWPLACRNFRDLKNVQVRETVVGGLTVMLQHNPARIISSAAKLEKSDIAVRRCFLCRNNRPAEQIMLKFEGRKGKKYHILVNPYPIFPGHLVIAMDRHVDQSIWNRYVDMLDMANKYEGHTFFYNGPKSGASAPDHHHFQAAPSGLMPLERDVDSIIDGTQEQGLTWLDSVQDAHLYHYGRFTTGVFVLRAQTAKSAAKMFYRLLDCADIPQGEPEPLFNLFTYRKDGEFRSIIVFRSRHRSHHYFSEGQDHLTMSPGCADMAGVFIVPVESEYHKITSELLTEMVREVSISEEDEKRMLHRLTRKQPYVNVGIMSGREIVFEILSDGAGVRKAVLKEGKIEYCGALYDELFFASQTLSTMFAQPSFILHGVTIGVGFHWQRQETQKFAGALKIIVSGGVLHAINIIGVEDYLLSVISSEMSATSSEEFLKAHSVISRSWLMAQMAAARRTRHVDMPEGISSLPELVSWLKNKDAIGMQEDSGIHEYVRWYDKEDHKLFDVCADDHCQRYQGLTRAAGDVVRRAIDSTWGEVLTYEGQLCDARFSKCCGGTMEIFSSCWEDKDYDYLKPLADSPGHDPSARHFCNTQDKGILAQVLNDYDQETVDFYRWRTVYGRKELSELISGRSGIDIGRLEALIPLERGESGRITRLKIIGSMASITVGKELEIRRLLSDTHLKSSAFDVEYLDQEGRTLPDPMCDWSEIALNGAGWGHGVGLCQIGAAVMASEGYCYKDILSHYYPGASLTEGKMEID